ncbi:MAG: hypothetical protein CMN25_08415 [Salinicola sp.]|uniref:hypothetical protein n=1 Tax=uncultured Salinicola sp. TaxID=1193542 RepID=UPI000C928B2F|nr:hypothetical protein [uncultured Salinicola sp.]MAM57342.1 hypothetical protein [Salinicola sp.]|tara:strand:- start:262 stop:450 length:189 start_codon:yes stop_codon:yes gene_type:complete
MSQTQRRQSPHGCNRPIMTLLTIEERAEVEAIASRELRSLSGTVRMLMLRGLQNTPKAEAVS